MILAQTTAALISETQTRPARPTLVVRCQWCEKHKFCERIDVMTTNKYETERIQLRVSVLQLTLTFRSIDVL